MRPRGCNLEDALLEEALHLEYMLQWGQMDLDPEQYPQEELRDAQEELLAGGAPPGSPASTYTTTTAASGSGTALLDTANRQPPLPSTPPPLPPSICLSQPAPIPGLWQGV